MALTPALRIRFMRVLGMFIEYDRTTDIYDPALNRSKRRLITMKIIFSRSHVCRCDKLSLRRIVADATPHTHTDAQDP